MPSEMKAPLLPGKSFLSGIDPAGFRRRRNDDPISLANHLDGLPRIQITSDSAIGYVSLAVHKACNRACERLGTA